MALSTKDIYILLKEINEYGSTIYYMLNHNKIDVDDITNVIFKDSIEKVNLLFPKFIEKITPEDIKEAHDSLKHEFTKLSCVDRIIQKDGNKHQHLREIRDIVNLDKKLNKMIKEKTYQNAFNLYYTNKILEKIEEHNKNNYLSRIEMLKLYRAAYEILLDESDKKISSNIDSYYITVITK